MLTPASSTAARAAATLPQDNHAFPLFLSAVWLGIKSATLNLLNSRDVSPGEASRLPHPETEPASFGLPPLHPHPTQIENPPPFIASYARALDSVWRGRDWSDVVLLVETLRRAWRENRQVFLCGNGGSAANAIHLANDLLYGVDKQSGQGLRVTALPANAAVLTCLANDIAYEDVFAQQLSVLAQPGDLLLAFSGSGNSPNILKALSRAKELRVTSFAILGFTGGRALTLADHPIYFPVHDMQVAEDLQMMVGHMAMQSLALSGR